MTDEKFSRIVNYSISAIAAISVLFKNTRLAIICGVATILLWLLRRMAWPPNAH